MMTILSNLENIMIFTVSTSCDVKGRQFESGLKW